MTFASTKQFRVRPKLRFPCTTKLLGIATTTFLSFALETIGRISAVRICSEFPSRTKIAKRHLNGSVLELMSRGHHSPGPAVSANPTATDSRKRPLGEIIRRVGVYLRPYPWFALGTIGCALLSQAASFAFPKLTRFVIDDVIGGGHADWLWKALVGLLAAFAFRDLFNSLRIRLNNVFEQHVIFDIRRDVYARLQRLPIAWFDQRSSGDLMTRVLEDVNAMERLLIDGAEQGVVALVAILGVGFILFHAQPLLASFALLPIPLLVVGALAYTLTAHDRYRSQRKASSAMNALLMDNLQGVRQIKLFGQEIREEKRFADKANELRKGTLIVMRVWSVYQPAMTFAAALGTVLVLWRGGRLVLESRMQVGQLVEFLLYLGMFYEPVAKLHQLNQMLQAARAAGERVFDILDTAPETTPSGDKSPFIPVPLPRPGEEWLRYEGVDFIYPNGHQALKSIHFTARAGDMIALVGPTGSGKSTLASLLPRFHEVTAGRVTLGGKNIQELELGNLRGMISVVSQEPFLFNGSVRENIAFGSPDATESQIRDAATAAAANQFIARLPQGYETTVGERGVRLSVGEKQRISIARALLRNTPLLILDEATASVDTATEQEIQQALERLMEGRTTVVIAHRLSTIRRANEILVLRQGEIVERGRHDALLELQGLYSKLWRAQTAVADWERELSFEERREQELNNSHNFPEFSRL